MIWSATSVEAGLMVDCRSLRRRGIHTTAAASERRSLGFSPSAGSASQCDEHGGVGTIATVTLTYRELVFEARSLTMARAIQQPTGRDERDVVDRARLDRYARASGIARRDSAPAPNPAAGSASTPRSAVGGRESVA